MDVIKTLQELYANLDLMKDNLDVLKKEIIKQEKSDKRDKNGTSDLVARAKARRALSRLS